MLSTRMIVMFELLSTSIYIYRERECEECMLFYICTDLMSEILFVTM